MSSRLECRFADLKAAGRGGLVVFITAGDPNADICGEILRGLPAAGADVIELGIPFTDPMADGPAIQASSLRALAGGQTLRRTLAMVADFRVDDSATPLILMGYYNPIYQYGVDRFLHDARAAGVDGLIVVDLPPEEDRELCLPAAAAGLHFIRLATPTTDAVRLPKVLANASGFVYYVSVTGITGSASAQAADIAGAVARLREKTDLPVAVGFGIRTPEQAAEVARVADAAVVGSAVVGKIGEGKSPAEILAFVGQLAAGVRAARKELA